MEAVDEVCEVVGVVGNIGMVKCLKLLVIWMAAIGSYQALLIREDDTTHRLKQGRFRIIGGPRHFCVKTVFVSPYKLVFTSFNC